MATLDMHKLTELYLKQCVIHGHDVADGILRQVLLDTIGKNAKDRIPDILQSVKDRARL